MTIIEAAKRYGALALSLLSLAVAVAIYWLVVGFVRPIGPDPVEVRIANYKIEVAAHVRDPNAVQWYKFHRFNSGAICGAFNIKNAFGGYTGIQRFIYVPGGVKAVWPHPFLGKETVQHGWLVTEFEFTRQPDVFEDTFAKRCRNIPSFEHGTLREARGSFLAIRSKPWGYTGFGLVFEKFMVLLGVAIPVYFFIQWLRGKD